MESISNIEKTINAFETMITSLGNIKFNPSFFTDLLEESIIIKSPRKFSKNYENRSVTVDLIRDLSIRLRKKQNHLTTHQQEYVEQLNYFLKQFQFANSLKNYFDDKIYTHLYFSCYQPHVFFNTIDNNNDDDDDEKSQYIGSTFLTEVNLSDSSNNNERQRCIINIINSVNELYIIHDNWTKLLLTNIPFDSTNMETEIQNQLISTNPSIQFCTFVFDDIYLKVQRIITLSKCWLSNFKQLTNEGLTHFSNLNNYSSAILNKVHEINSEISNLDKEMEHLEKSIENNIISFEELKAKETKMFTLISKSDNVLDTVDSINSDYESLLAKRVKLIDELDKSITGTTKYQELSKRIINIENQIIEKYQDLRMSHYSLAISQEDSNQYCNTLKDFTRWSESLKISIEDQKVSLNKILFDKKTKEEMLKRINTNLCKMKDVLGKKINALFTDYETISNGRSLAFTTKTYTIKDEDRRFGDAEDFLFLENNL